MATLTPVNSASTGTAFVLAAASGGGDSIAVGTAKPRTLLLVCNGGVGSINVTLTGSVNCSQGSTHNSVVAVGAGINKMITIPSTAINDTTGACAVTYSGVTTVTVCPIYAN